MGRSDRGEANVRLGDCARHHDTDQMILNAQFVVDKIVDAGVHLVVRHEEDDPRTRRVSVDLPHLEGKKACLIGGVEELTPHQRDQRDASANGR